MKMERKLRAVVLLEIHLIWVFVFFMHGQSSANYENVIDLVEALNIPHQKNVTSGMIYKLRPRAPHLTLPAEYSHFLYSNLQGSMGVHVVARQAPRSTATVFSLSSASSPILQIISSTLDNTLRLDYQAEGRPHSSASFHFPGTNPFSSGTWVQLAVSLEPDRLTFFVDCQEAAVLQIESENRINLELPQDVLVTLGSTLGKRDSKFIGYLKTAELSLKSYSRRPWICNNLTDDLAPPGTHNPDSWTESNHPHDALPSKLQANQKSLDQTYHHLQDIQRHQRAVVQKPKRSPRAVQSASQVEKLEKRIEELTRVLGTISDEKDDELQKIERRMGKLASVLDMVIDERDIELHQKEKIRELTHALDMVIKENQKLKKDVNCVTSDLKDQCNKGMEKNESSLRDGEKSKKEERRGRREVIFKDCCQTPACNGGNRECSPQPCLPQPCLPQPCLPQNCTDCQTPVCNGDNRECPHQPCPHQPCPTQDCKEENVPDCQRHICDGGPPQVRALQLCDSQLCPPQNCTEENVPEGCNQQTTSCTHSVTYNHGDSWRSVENPCAICSCSEGQVHCESEQCNTACRNPAAPPPNSCCPVCDGCAVNGHDFPNGAVIPAGDPCQECACVDGNVICSPVHCPVLSCHNPVHHAGECCPRCEQCQFESKVYMTGETFTSRRHPCLQCHCSAGEVSCEHMAASCPTPRCSHPAKHRGQCCPTCSDCEYEQRVYADGTAFPPAGSGPCLQCRCKGGNVLCNEEKCPPVYCSNPVRDPHHCCPVCKNQ